jgi:PAS domain S-box-containing protein
MQKTSVLYVDDEPDLLNIAKIFIEKTGSFHLTPLSSAEEALNHLKKNRYDVIISDYQMPGMDGITFLKKFRESQDNVPFILFTGKGREEVVIEALNSGADSYVQKGGNPTAQFAELIQKIIITVERRQAQKALLESEKKYRQLVENAQEGVCVIQDEKIVFANPKIIDTVKMGGISIEKMYSQPFYSFIHPAEQDLMRERYQQRILNNEMFPAYPFRFVTNGGEIRWWEIDAVRIEWNNRPATLNFTRDVTEQYHLRQEVSESECRYRELVEFLPKTVMEFDDQFCLTFLNATGRKKFAYSTEDLNGKVSLLDLVSPEEQEKVLQIYQHAKKGNLNTEYETVARRKDGTTFPMQVYPCTIRHNMQITGFRVVCIDISEYKKNEQKAVQARNKMDLLFQIARHDILNKLTVLRGYLEMAKHSTTDGPTLVCLQQIGDVATGITEQVKFVKTYLEIGQSDPEWLNVEDIISVVQRCFPTDLIGIEVRLDGLELFGDRLLEKVIYNLFDNTFRHGGCATKIVITSMKKGRDLMVIYEDNGAGISQSDKTQVFSRGFGKNSGLGLFICQEILAMTEITIRETGMPGRGVRFEIIVPKGKFRFTQKRVNGTA